MSDLLSTCRQCFVQDKKALEDRLKEVQNILETVQNQRNELRQQYKEEKTARESLEAQLSAAQQQGAGDLAAEKENAQQNIAQLEARQQAADTALQEARQTAQTNLDNANAVKARLQSELITAQQKMASLQKERSEVESKATAVREDLMNRLNNALKQRDAAREEALLSKEELKKLQEDVESGALVPRSAVTAAEAAAALAATQAASSAASSAAAAAAAATPSVSAPHAQDPGNNQILCILLACSTHVTIRNTTCQRIETVKCQSMIMLCRQMQRLVPYLLIVFCGHVVKLLALFPEQ